MVDRCRSLPSSCAPCWTRRTWPCCTQSVVTRALTAWTTSWRKERVVGGVRTPSACVAMFSTPTAASSSPAMPSPTTSCSRPAGRGASCAALGAPRCIEGTPVISCGPASKGARASTRVDRHPPGRLLDLDRSRLRGRAPGELSNGVPPRRRPEPVSVRPLSLACGQARPRRRDDRDAAVSPLLRLRRRRDAQRPQCRAVAAHHHLRRPSAGGIDRPPPHRVRQVPRLEHAKVAEF